jgi:hypothetical protein
MTKFASSRMMGAPTPPEPCRTAPSCVENGTNRLSHASGASAAWERGSAASRVGLSPRDADRSIPALQGRGGRRAGRPK